MKPMFDRDVDALARTAWGENRGGGSDGMQSVMNVVINRATAAEAYAAEHGRPHPLFGDGTVFAAAHAREQFSCWNENDPNMHKCLAVDDSDPAFAAAKFLAASAQAGNLDDLTGGATSYYALSMPEPPYWARGHEPLCTIAGQAFFTGV